MMTSIDGIRFFQMLQLTRISATNITEHDVCRIANDELNNLLANDFTHVAHLIAFETILSKRIPERDFSDFINFLRFTITDVTVTDIENALVSCN